MMFPDVESLSPLARALVPGDLSAGGDDYGEDLETDATERMGRYAWWIAERHNLEEARVRSLLVKIANMRHGARPPLAPDYLYYMHTALMRALECGAKDDVIHLFESADPCLIVRRDCLVCRLAWADCPLYTLDELAQLIEHYTRHREQNSDLLVRTGWPNRSFGPSPWIDHLSPLHPTKLPVEAYDQVNQPLLHGRRQGRRPITVPDDCGRSTGDRTDVERGINYVYTWVPVPGPVVVRADGSLIREVKEPTLSVPLKPCGYEAACLMNGLSPDRAATIESNRARMLQLRHDVLRVCAACLRSRNPDLLWTEVLNRLTRVLTSDDLTFYLELDRFYQRRDLAGDPVWVEGFPEPLYGLIYADLGSSLLDLLRIVGHCEKELRVGTMTWARENLVRLAPALSPISSYYEAIGKQGIRKLDEILDGCEELMRAERPFWHEYAQRVGRAIETEFGRATIVVSRRVDPSWASSYEASLGACADFLQAQLEISGSLPPLALQQSASSGEIEGAHRRPARPEEYLFRREGLGWLVRFGGREERTPPWKAMNDIHYVLERYMVKREAVRVPVMELIRASDPPPAAPADYQQPGTYEEGSEDDGWSILAPGVSLLEVTRQDYAASQDALGQLEHELAEARSSGGLEDIRKLDERIRKLRKAISKDFDRKGRPRAAMDQLKRPRQAVSKRFRECLVKLYKVHEPLARHLDTYLRPGAEFRYAPAEPIDWIL